MKPSNNGEPLNGLAGRAETIEKAKKARSKRKKKEEPAATEFATKDNRGRIASMIDTRKVEWFINPWIPKGMLSIVAGMPAVGKSTFIAYLLTKAIRACILPGFEEDVEVTTIPRLQALKTPLGGIKFLDDVRYSFPKCEKAVMKRLKEWGAELLVLDPIDSYMEDGKSENTAGDVRAFLESLSVIAKETGAAVVGVRHPGKDRTNIMPGSRAWRAVPRSIVELCRDGSIPPRLIIRHSKDSLGTDSKPREYGLPGERGAPRVFILKEERSGAMNEGSWQDDDPAERLDVMEACRRGRWFMTHNEKPLVEEFKKLCALHGISDRARRKAMERLGITSKPGTFGADWVMVRSEKEWPDWCPEIKE